MILDKLYYNTWNIGFVNRSISNIIESGALELEGVHWLKHPYKDRFFADPFILSVDEEQIQVLVEEFPYFCKRGIISLLTIDRIAYTLINRQVICEMGYHQSYPFILRSKNNIQVLPEASESGSLWVYDFDQVDYALSNRRSLIDEPLLDSTLIEYNGLWYLFATKRGEESNKNLYIYYSESPTFGFKSFDNNPVKSDLGGARPAGYIVAVKENLYRLAQVCTNHYGEAIKIFRIEELAPNRFRESFIREIRLRDKEYGYSFHTLNGFSDICVVDGVKQEFSPFMRIKNEILNLLRK